jgi:hypothetical protein
MGTNASLDVVYDRLWRSEIDNNIHIAQGFGCESRGINIVYAAQDTYFMAALARHFRDDRSRFPVSK